MNELDILLEPVRAVASHLDTYWPGRPELQRDLLRVLQCRPDFVEYIASEWTLHREEEREILCQVGVLAGYRVTFTEFGRPIFEPLVVGGDHE
jgi:hypothetical protein